MRGECALDPHHKLEMLFRCGRLGRSVRLHQSSEGAAVRGTSDDSIAYQTSLIVVHAESGVGGDTRSLGIHPGGGVRLYHPRQ